MENNNLGNGYEEILEKIAIALNPKKKTNKIFYFIIFAIGYIIFDFLTSNMMFNEYMDFRILWLQENSQAVIAVAITSFLTMLSYMGFNLKGALFVKLIPQVINILGFKDQNEAAEASKLFLEKQKQEAILKIQNRISDNLKSVFDIEHKLNTPKLLTLEQRDKLLDIAELFIKDLYNDGKEYVLNYDPNTPLKETPTLPEGE